MSEKFIHAFTWCVHDISIILILVFSCEMLKRESEKTAILISKLKIQNLAGI